MLVYRVRDTLTLVLPLLLQNRLVASAGVPMVLIPDMLTLVLPYLLRNRLVASACVPCTRHANNSVLLAQKQVGSLSC